MFKKMSLLSPALIFAVISCNNQYDNKDAPKKNYSQDAKPEALSSENLNQFQKKFQNDQASIVVRNNLKLKDSADDSKDPKLYVDVCPIRYETRKDYQNPSIDITEIKPDTLNCIEKVVSIHRNEEKTINFTDSLLNHYLNEKGEFKKGSFFLMFHDNTQQTRLNFQCNFTNIGSTVAKSVYVPWSQVDSAKHIFVQVDEGRSVSYGCRVYHFDSTKNHIVL